MKGSRSGESSSFLRRLLGERGCTRTDLSFFVNIQEKREKTFILADAATLFKAFSGGFLVEEERVVGTQCLEKNPRAFASNEFPKRHVLAPALAMPAYPAPREASPAVWILRPAPAPLPSLLCTKAPFVGFLCGVNSGRFDDSQLFCQLTKNKLSLLNK